ncbi:MAG: hypothetical protein KAG37_03745 [Flavobacteriales bacterium]|nr:hypothetical protein [Flavobacteriales bacterium]
MKRIIVDFRKMSRKIKHLFRSQYPDGYDTNDIIEFRNHRNELVKALEVKGKDTRFLVKISTSQGISVDKLNVKV